MFCNANYGNRQRVYCFTFRVIDTNDCSISGAVYRLTCPCGRFINAISGSDGCVTFCRVCPGSYELTQVAAPYGYAIDPAAHEVTIQRGGCTKIDGLPLRCFNSINERVPPIAPDPSAPPTIAAPSTATVTINGTGIPGCKVEVIYPDGSSCWTCVRRDGSWTVDVPDDITLIAGQEIRAVQICGCQPRSEAVIAIVTQA